MEPPRKRSQTRPLLSVAAAVSLVACGSSGSHNKISTDNAAASAPSAIAAPQPIVPRLLPSGSPACGNVSSKAPRPPECNDR